VGLARRHRIDQVAHPIEASRRVLAVRERVVRSLKASKASRAGAQVAFRQVLPAQRRQEPLLLVEVHQSLQVEHVVEGGVIGVELRETVDRGERQRALVVLVVNVSQIDLRLLRPAAEG
jgi:hypothetical protein